MSALLSQIRTELRIEYRSWAQSAALFLFVLVIAFVIYKIKESTTFSMVEFNFIYWTFIMLISISIAIRTEGHNDEGEHLLVYTLISPLTAFVARYTFNVIYLLVVGTGFYLALILFFSPQISFEGSFFILIVCGAFAIAAALSFTSAISSHLAGQNTLLNILSIPVLIPVVLTLNNMGVSQFMQGTVEMSSYIILLSVSLLSIAISLVLFPMVWRQ